MDLGQRLEADDREKLILQVTKSLEDWIALWGDGDFWSRHNAANGQRWNPKPPFPTAKNAETFGVIQSELADVFSVVVQASIPLGGGGIFFSIGLASRFASEGGSCFKSFGLPQG